MKEQHAEARPQVDPSTDLAVSAGGATTLRAPSSASQLVEHFFRHESGRLVAILSRVFGLKHFDLVEDMVQAALLEALRAWRTHGPPENPSAWVHRVAKNKIQDALRRDAVLQRVAPEVVLSRAQESAPTLDDCFLDSEISDAQLRMVFACCHPSLSRENQISLTLKALGGFSFAEISRALLLPEETVKKRVQRAKQQLISQGVELAAPQAAELPLRLDAVHQCLYLMFNEGYAASQGDSLIRQDVCEEAARLCHLIVSHERTHSTSGEALLALMLLHAARLGARTDPQGRLMLLEDQDRSHWDQRLIAEGKRRLDLSAQGRSVSLFHLEAGIAWTHCQARSVAETNWPQILALYNMLIATRDSPIYRLNRAIVIGQIEGPAAALEALLSLREDPALKNYHLVDSAIGEMHRRLGDYASAAKSFTRALTACRSLREREFLHRRLLECQGAA
jgi:RNA polymerase sigma factor (sigma-70 family)